MDIKAEAVANPRVMELIQLAPLRAQHRRGRRKPRRRRRKVPLTHGFDGKAKSIEKQCFWVRPVEEVVLVVAIAIIASASNAFAQCASAAVSVQGTVENLSQGTAADVVVVLKTPRGDFSKTAEVSDGHFRIDVSFSTFKSWSPLTGHHCSNIPKVVDVAVRRVDHVLVQEELKFKDSFETRDSLSYNLKRKLVLDASGKH